MIYFVLVVMFLALVALIFMCSIPDNDSVKNPGIKVLEKAVEQELKLPTIKKEIVNNLNQYIAESDNKIVEIDAQYENEESMKKKKQQNITLEWFVVERALDTISPAEKLIADELSRYQCAWYREVAFTTLKTSKHGYARFDFLVIADISPVGFFLLEYDGKLSHMSDEQLARDTMKNKFCYKNSIPIVRYSSVHYFQIPYQVSMLMHQYKIKKK